MIELIYTVKRISNDNKIQSCDLFVNAITWSNLIGESKMELFLSFIHLFIILFEIALAFPASNCLGWHRILSNIDFCFRRWVGREY